MQSILIGRKKCNYSVNHLFSIKYLKFDFDLESNHRAWNRTQEISKNKLSLNSAASRICQSKMSKYRIKKISVDEQISIENLQIS
jgi:hypothetical protein